MSKTNAVTKTIFSLMGVVLTAFIVANSFIMVDEGKRSVIYRFQFAERLVTSGFNLKMPFIERAVAFDADTSKVQYTLPAITYQSLGIGAHTLGKP